MDSGISYDEYSQSTYGNYILAWFRSGFTDQSADRVVITSDYAHADLLIAVRRAECHRRPGVTLATVNRQGTPLVYIRRIKH